MANYDHLNIEKKWQEEWDKNKVYKAESPSDKKKFYVLDMFPYPSGVGLHVGHPRGYIGSDVYARLKRMEGYNVLHPMGYDAFGLPAEQYAVEHNIHPRAAVEANVATFEHQLSIIGLSYDWDRRVNTTDPDFYHWTQWIFLKIYNSWYNTETNKAEPIETLLKKFERGEKETDWNNKTEKEKQDTLMNYRLAYEGYASVNWCPKLGTVLANDEIVDTPDGPVSERGGYPVEKKLMRQWFMRITSYADRLLAGLDGLNWSEHIKEIQRNWIGKSEGLIFSAKVRDTDITIQTFSAHYEGCYADTFFVIAPDHPLLPKLLEGVPDKEEILAEAKDIIARRDATKEGDEKIIEGVFTGRYGIDPLGNGDLPIWIASFALKDYGTGIVKCSAHDVRDFVFAKKYNIKLKEIIEPLIIQTSGEEAARKDVPLLERHAMVAVIKHWSEDKYLGVEWKKNSWKGFNIGGVEEGEDAIQAGIREIFEETGYKNPEFVKKLGGIVHSQFYQSVKKVNRFAHFEPLLFTLRDGERGEIDESEKALHNLVWLTPEEMDSFITHEDMKIIWSRVRGTEKPILEGILTEPSEFAGREIHEAREDIANWLVEKGFAIRKSNYKMRDAIFARQRYWGEPIPLTHDSEGIIHPLAENELPLKLPDVESYQPLGTGESPLAGVPSWIEKGYETNTMPGWAGSSWYFLRYMDPKNTHEFASKEALEYWRDVDMYIGGAEHATGHLLYARFWHKFLYDMNLVPTDEPFKALKNQGMIGGADGRKMSKRWGNVINPDDVVKTYGADTLRIYEMFMGPFGQSLPWSTESIIGSRRFLEKVWKLATKITSLETDLAVPLEKLLHKTIKKVTEDIESFNFNTAISTMMIFVNEAEKVERVSVEDYKKFLHILAPFAPHMTEELWHELGEKESIHTSPWPVWDKEKIIDDEIKIMIQVNGKIRGEIIVPPDTSEQDLQAQAKVNPDVIPWIESKEIKRAIYVPGKLINLVV